MLFSVAGSWPFSLLGLFWAIFTDFGAECAGDMGGSGGGSRRSFFWVSNDAFGALEMGNEFCNWHEYNVYII